MKFTNILLALSLSATVSYAADTRSTTATGSIAVTHSAPNPSSTGQNQGGSHGKGKHDHSGKDHEHGKGNHTHSAVEAECDKIHHLTELADLAKNTTKLNELVSKHHLNATEVAKIKEKAANATIKLDKLESNATLVSECAHIKATETAVDKGLATSTASAQAARSTSRAAIGLAVGKGLLSVSVLTGLAMFSIA